MAVIPVWHSAADVQAATKERLNAAETIRQELLAVRGARTLQNTLLPYNDMLIQLDRVFAATDLMANVHPDAGVRAEAEKSQQQLAVYVNSLRLDRDLFQAISSVPDDGLDSQSKRFRFLLLRDYRRAGVDKDDSTRRRLAGLFEEMIATGQEFDRNIREDKRSITVPAGALAGLPADYIASHPPGPDGKITITTELDDFEPFMKYAEREDLRRELYIIFQQRAYPANDAVLKKLLDLRHEYATLLGYPDWASYNAGDKMVKSDQAIADFIDRVATMAGPRSRQDLDALLARKRLDSPQADLVHGWDAAYYQQKVRAERFGVNFADVRRYFEFSRVKEGILATAQDLFDVRFNRVPGADVWHESIEAYDVSAGKRFLGRFYLDLHPRENKFSHIAVFQMLTGVPGRQPAQVALVGNFPGPGTPDEPALLERQDVITFLHEFGHLMHHLLASTSPWVTMDGISTEWDFVETPSQLLEEWGRDAGVLRGFARDYLTGEPIPADLVEKMRQADEFGKGVLVTRQMAYARLSLAFHDQDPANMDLLDVTKQVMKDYSPYPYEENTYFYTSFGHLNGYSSAYYTYMWSLSLEKDIFTVFRKNGLTDRKTARLYREKILEPGGSLDAADLVKNFLGREYSFEAFRQWLEE